MLYVLSMSTPDAVPIFELYGRWVVSSGLLERIERQLGEHRRRGIYSLVVVLWLMIWQRLQPRGTLSQAVRQLNQGAGRSLLSPCKRVRECRISAAPGGYCQSVKKLSKLVPQQVTRDIVAQLRQQIGEPWPGLSGAAYLLDGSSLLLPHTRKLVRAYPPANNQHGVGHWPMMRMVVLHDVSTGLALYPRWGPMYGERATSEQALAVAAMENLPAGAVVVADRNFGVFSIAWEAGQRQHGVVVRLTEVRARKLFGGPIREPGDWVVDWIASRWDQPQATAWPAGAKCSGRLLAARVGRGKSKHWLYLFTTLDVPTESVVALYGQRWNIGVSSQGHIVQSVRDRPRPKDSGLVAGEASWRESKTAEPSDNMLGKECAQRTRLQRTVNADVASLHESPVAETVDNARKQQELTETSPKRQFSPAGYQRRHGVKDDVETGEALGARRRNLVEEMPAITASGKCWHRHQGGGSGRSTDDGRAAKRARREGPGPVSVPSGKVRQG